MQICLSKVLIATAFFASFAATPAKAVLVTYDTNLSTLTCNTGCQSPIGITYSPTSGTVDADPNTFASLGHFTVSTTTNTNTNVDADFTLTISQMDPSMGMGSLTADVMGRLKSNSSTTSVSFLTDTITIGSVTYRLRSKIWDLVPPTTNGGITTIQAEITAIPEPSFVILSSLGMMGLLGVAYGRTRRSES